MPCATVKDAGSIVSIPQSDFAPIEMLRDLTRDQRLRADFMSDLSEEAYYAGWMDGFEYALWEAVIEVRREYGRLALTGIERARVSRRKGAVAGSYSTTLPKRPGCRSQSGRDVSQHGPCGASPWRRASGRRCRHGLLA
jgi:hypothetical protein